MGRSDDGQALVRISSVTRDLRFRPPIERVAVNILDRLRRAWKTGLTIGGVTWVVAIGVGYVGAPGFLIEVLLAAGLGAVVLGGAVQVTGSLVRGPLALAQWRRMHGPRGSHSVSIVGHVVALRTVRAPSGEDVVAFRARFTRAGRGPEVERAQPFWLDDGKGDPVLVDVEHLYLADPLSAAIPGGSGLPVEAIDLLPSIDAPTEHRELLLRAGDRVEVAGWLASEVDPRMSTHFRGVPLRRVIRGTPEAALTVRQRRAPPAPTPETK